MSRSSLDSLPRWEQMSDLDRGAALMHTWKCHWEGPGYARAEYPCIYIDDPALLALTRRDANEHARHVAGSYGQALAQLGEDEFDRLYELACGEGQRIRDSRKGWAFRHENGNVSVCDTREAAEFHCWNPSWRAIELLQRHEPGGGWTVVADYRGIEQVAPFGWVCPGDQVLWGRDWRAVTDAGSVRRMHDGRETAVRWLTLANGLYIEPPAAVESTHPNTSWQVLIRRRQPPHEHNQSEIAER